MNSLIKQKDIHGAYDKYNKTTDEEIITKYLQDRDIIYWNILYRRYIDKILSKCEDMLGNEVLAQDATQEIFIKIYTNIEGFQQKSSFSTWVYSITHNHCIDTKRKIQKIRESSDNLRYYLLGEEDTRETDAVLLEEKTQILEKIFHTVSKEQKQILIMKYVEGKTTKEISQILKATSESAIKMRLLRARKKLEKQKDKFNHIYQ